MGGKIGNDKKIPRLASQELCVFELSHRNDKKQTSDYYSDSPSSLSKALINPSIREGMRSPKSFNALPAS